MQLENIWNGSDSALKIMEVKLEIFGFNLVSGDKFHLGFRGLAAKFNE